MARMAGGRASDGGVPGASGAARPDGSALYAGRRLPRAPPSLRINAPLSLLSLQVSKCSEEIKNYIEERSGEDPLVKGVPEDKNPFKEKGGCVIA
ncbi:PREDICTED: guanine nucleotide-binding protein G(I)/G(S)/G(O) subunit gamma-11-like [Calidris pugnax]|uniref:guanine nucleotide-binding protein G(I)/G(S)/G(O) subunit gamma-11-like n=1 Tax=Calidris pugnax TaxID=198806 RepID=UPI00071E0D1A|nr:PREDICTED: guanine nucleotide-binding protein G(I)/G(S)/G(O) subunit gamma-11-like [Calidris pugnax]